MITFVDPKNPDEEVPPFVYTVYDPVADRWHYVFTYVEVTDFEILRRYVAKWMGERMRKMPKNFDNLPQQVRLVVDKDGSVRPHGLPTQRELEDAQKAEDRRKKQIEKRHLSLRKKTKKNHPEK